MCVCIYNIDISIYTISLGYVEEGKLYRYISVVITKLSVDNRYMLVFE